MNKTIMKDCLICSTTAWSKKFFINDIFDERYNFGYCNSCRVYSLNPFPDSRQLAQAYDESYYGFGDKKFNSSVEKVVNWFRSRNAKQFAKRLPNKATILDIGCGNGGFLESLGKYGEFKLHGIEPPGKSGDRAASIKSLDLHRGFLKSTTYPNNYFDAIVLTHVFEHLPNPMEVLEVITNMSKIKGVLQIEIPNIDSLQYRLFKSKWLHLDPPRHLNMFPPKVLIKNLQNLGWEVESQRFFSPQFSPFGAQQSLLNIAVSKRELLYEHLKGNITYCYSSTRASLFLQKLFHWFSFPFFVCTDAIASIFNKGATVKLRFRKV
jgi:SAM-dependent methyltransferase